MPGWINRTQDVAARNGTSSHTVPFTAASAGNLLIAIVDGPVTSTTPAGWTLVASAVNNTGLYVWRKTATAGESSFSTTHNGSNYPVEFAVYEYPSGSTVAGTAGSGISGNYTDFVAVTGLPGTAVEVIGVAGTYWGAAEGGISVSFTSPWTKDVDAATPYSGNEGAFLGVCYASGITATSATPVGTVSKTTGSTGEWITFAISVAASTPITVTVGQPTETDTALGLGRRKVRTLGQAAETDTGQTTTRRKARTAGQPADTSSPLAAVRRKVRALGQPAETDLAQALQRAGRVLVGQVVDVATALGALRRRLRTLGQPAEADSAAAAAHRKTRTAGQAQETDAALAMEFGKGPTRLTARAGTSATRTATARPNDLTARGGEPL